MNSLALHHGRHGDSHHREGADEFAADHGDGRQQKFLFLFVSLGEDRVAVIESVEELRQLEDMLSQMSRFGGGDALVNDVGSFRRCQPEFPKVVVGFAGEKVCKIGGGDVARYFAGEFVGIESAFAKNVGGANHRVLRVRAGLAFEAQRLFEIEGDHGRLGELEHEVAQSANGDLAGDGGALGVPELGMASVDFLSRRGNQSVDQIVGFYSEALAARDFNVWTRFVFLRKLVTQVGGATRGKRDHLIRKMGVVVGLLVVAESAESFNYGVLRLGLAGVNHIVDFGYVAEVGMVECADGG